MTQHPTDVFRMSCGATAPLELNVSGPGWAGSERCVFEHPFALVGRHEHSCLRLEHGEVSRRHAYLQQLGGRVFCIDLGSRTRIRWGGEPRPAGWLRPEQRIQIGPFTLELAMAARAGEGPDDRVAEDWDPLQDRANDSGFLPRVTVEDGNKVLSRLHMNRALVLVGSSPACRVRLRDTGVSRYHCSLLRTPQGVWVIDLLNGTGTCLNGQPLRWALMKEGDRLQVGPYVLRVRYPDGRMETSPPCLVEIPAGMPVQPADNTLKSGQRPSQDQGGLKPAATEASVLVHTLQAELDQARERQRDAEILRQQLADSQAECDWLREQARVFEVQLAELADLQVRLEAAQAKAHELESIRAECDRLREQARALEVQLTEMAGLQSQLETAEANARELDVIRGERDRWQSEAYNLQARLTSASAQQEQLDRLAADLHAAQAERDRLHSEQQTFQHAAEQAWLRVAELERALTEAATGHETALEAARGRWESERQALEARLELECQGRDGAVEAAVREVQAKAAAEREQWRQQLEAAQQQLIGEREAVRAASARLDQESAILQRVQADLAARNAEHGTALQRLQEIQEELALSQDRARSLQAELDQALERQRDIEALRQQLADSRAEHAQLGACVRELEGRANSVDRLEAQLRDANAETEQLRAQLRAAESREAELHSVRAECDRLCEQARALEVQLAEVAGLQARLEAAEANAHELEAVRSERDRLREQARALEVQVAEAASLQARLEAADRREAQLQDASAEIERLQVQLRAAESQGAELDSVRAECDRLREQAHALEVQLTEMADLQARLEDAEANARELDVIRGERDRWQAEAQELQARLATDSDGQEQLGRLAADLHAAQAERDRLHSEQQTFQHAAEQAGLRVAELERALTEAAAGHETTLEAAHGRWESERQALEARLELECQGRDGAVEAAVREVQAKAAAEREQWRQRLEGAELQLVWERGMFQEQSEQIRRQAANLQAERDHLAARLAQAELRLRMAEERSSNEAVHAAELQHLRQQAARDQVFVQLSGTRLGHMLQTVRTQDLDAPAEQARPRAPLVRERVPVEEPGRPTVIVQEVQAAAWGESAGGQERLPVICKTPDRVGGQVSEVGPDGSEDKAVEYRSAPASPLAVPAGSGEASAPSDAPQDSAAPLEERQPAEDAHDGLAQRKDSRPEARQKFWRQILGLVRGK